MNTSYNEPTGTASLKASPQLETARQLLDAGLSIIPIKTDGSKAPSLTEWKSYQTKAPTGAEIEEWFSSREQGIGIICGAVSGNLEVIDFDDYSAYGTFRDLAERDPYIKSLLEKAVIVGTPTGLHLYYRCEEPISGNQKLACLSSGQKNEAGKNTLIETRGEGGYVIAVGSPASTHPSGELYKPEQNDYYAIPTISADDRELLLSLAKSLNQKVAPERGGEEFQRNEDPDAPGNAYNEKADWSELLTRNGWRQVYSQGDTQYWQRPGKESGGPSATLNHGGTDRLYVFSSNAEPFEAERGFSKFQAYALLEHGGDFSKAAKQLLADGYGKAKYTETKDRGKKTDSAKLIEIGSGYEYFTTPSEDVYVKVLKGEHREVYSVKGKEFSRILLAEHYSKTGRVPNASAVEEAVQQLAGLAWVSEATPSADAHIRIARHNGKVYLDLCNDKWEAVEIDRDGWRVIQNPPVLFQRHAGMLPLPIPVKDGSIEDLRRFVNCNDDDFILLKGWVVGVFNPAGSYPILEVCGGQGSAKSYLCRIIKRLVDPAIAEIELQPRSRDDVKFSANTAWLLAYDNISGISAEMSDLFCVISTGTVMKDRALYTNNDMIYYQIKRPVIWNGIDTIAVKGDLQERTIKIRLEKLTSRMREGIIDAEFDRARPGILGGICDAISAAIRNEPSITIEELPRLADFAHWVTAAEGALDLEPGQYLRLYNQRLTEEKIENAENDEFCQVVIKLVDRSSGQVRETSTELLRLLTDLAPERLARSRNWPTTRVSDWLNRRVETLRAAGIEVGSHRSREKRYITLERIARDGGDRR